MYFHKGSRDFIINSFVFRKNEIERKYLTNDKKF